MDTPAIAAQIFITLIPIVGIIGGCTVIIVFLYFNHKQKILLIEKNLYKKPDFNLDTFSLFTGFVLLGVGGSLTLVFSLINGISYSLLGGVIPLFLGISMILYYLMKVKINKNG